MSCRFLSFLFITYIAKQFVPICFARSRIIRQIGLESTEVIFCKHFIPCSYFTHPLFHKILQILYDIVGSMQDKLAKYCWQCSNLFIKTYHIDYLHNIHVYLFIYNVESYSSAKFDVQTVQTNLICMCFSWNVIVI